MNDQLFRKKSMDRISSPEQLKDYIKVANPGVWVLMLSILIILFGICFWGIFGRLDTTVEVGLVVENRQGYCYIKDADADTVKAGMPLVIDGQEYKIREISSAPVQVDDSFAGYLSYVGGLTEGEWVYRADLEGEVNADDGIHKGEIIVERVAPMVFVLN